MRSDPGWAASTQALHEYHSLRVIRRQPRAPKRNARSIDEEVQKKLACACCLEPPEEKVETPCGHSFCNGPYNHLSPAPNLGASLSPRDVRCAGCLTQWLRMHGSGRKCPVCREDLSALARTLSSALRRPEGDGHEAEEEAE